MIAYEELKALNAQIVGEALRDLGLNDPRADRLERIRKICEDHVGKNESLKKRLQRDAQYQLRCQAIDARSLPLRDILNIIKEGA